MHFVAAAACPTAAATQFHSGETEDARFFLCCCATATRGTTAAVGVSFGGNVTCYLAQQAPTACWQAAVVVSASLMLEPCAYRMEQGFGVYQRHLLGQLKQNATRKPQTTGHSRCSLSSAAERSGGAFASSTTPSPRAFTASATPPTIIAAAAALCRCCRRSKRR